MPPVRAMGCDWAGPGIWAIACFGMSKVAIREIRINGFFIIRNGFLGVQNFNFFRLCFCSAAYHVFLAKAVWHGCRWVGNSVTPHYFVFLILVMLNLE
jgi:hypothetical protein